MQVVKNGLYRSIGEVVDLLGAPDGETSGRSASSCTTRSTTCGRTRSRFPRPCSPSRWSSSASSATRPSRSTPCATTTSTGRRFPRGRCSSRSTTATATTSRTRCPSWRRTAFPAVIFAPIAYLADGRPLPHEEPLRTRGRPQPDARLGSARRARGRRRSHRGARDRASAVSRSCSPTRRCARSRSRSCGSRSGWGARWRRTRTSRARAPTIGRSTRASSSRPATSSASLRCRASNTPDTDRFQLLRYNVEPYSARTFELVLAGACDPLSVKDTVAGTYVAAGGQRAFSASATR